MNDIELRSRWTPEKVNLLRARRGWSRAELAFRLGFKLSNFVKWEEDGGQLPVDRLLCFEKWWSEVNLASKNLHKKAPADELLSKFKLSQISLIEVDSLPPSKEESAQSSET
ncbi:MAG: hypothetical protein COT74_06750 [Bdellovibrionales bacterium CG10_big_fil_rev_8_21_14_0_10_45_34]|nr:MAG: hypothetical protein COT74_06750 [Bdellovibrionales bacterium CG10_big_fil_rev_8_21_14_0_10_45_34]